MLLNATTTYCCIHSGTTWLREITRHLLYKSNEKDLEIVSKINQMYEYIDMALRKFPCFQVDYTVN